MAAIPQDLGEPPEPSNAHSQLISPAVPTSPATDRCSACMHPNSDFERAEIETKFYAYSIPIEDNSMQISKSHNIFFSQI